MIQSIKTERDNISAGDTGINTILNYYKNFYTIRTHGGDRFISSEAKFFLSNKRQRYRIYKKEKYTTIKTLNVGSAPGCDRLLRIIWKSSCVILYSTIFD